MKRRKECSQKLFAKHFFSFCLLTQKLVFEIWFAQWPPPPFLSNCLMHLSIFIFSSPSLFIQNGNGWWDQVLEISVKDKSSNWSSFKRLQLCCCLNLSCFRMLEPNFSYRVSYKLLLNFVGLLTLTKYTNIL